MIAELKPYPAMKDSGVSWLGEVPEHWQVLPPKRVLRSRSSGAAPIKNTASAEPQPDYVPAFSASGQDVWLPEPMFHEPGLVLSAVGARCGKTFRANGAWAIVANTHVLLVNEGQDRDFWWYVTNDEGWWARAGAAQPFVQVSKTLDRPWAVPPPSEQAAIVRFLDHADRRIRRYIRAKQKLIKLLEEQKQAIIHRAVTRGLDPNVRLKPSGMEWLGDVPEHWEVSRVKNEFLCLNRRRVPLSATERGTMTLQEYDYYGASGVIDKVDEYLFDDDLLLIAEDGANLVLRNLPLAIIARGKFWVNNHAHVLKPMRGNLEYLAAVMERINYQPWISGAAQPKLTQDRLMGIAVAVAPPEEQDVIVRAMSEETAPLRATIERARREIELLREYRTRLIADVVTGKLDVREAAARLPDEVEEPESLDEIEAEGDTAEAGADDTDAVPEEAEA